MNTFAALLLPEKTLKKLPQAENDAPLGACDGVPPPAGEKFFPGEKPKMEECLGWV